MPCLEIEKVERYLKSVLREIEASYYDLVEAVKSKVRIPVAVKLAPYFTSMANIAVRLDRAGADALVLFNRFYQPDFDLEALEVIPRLTLSSFNELRLRLAALGGAAFQSHPL